MKKTFATRLEAIEWIASQARDEGQFEVWREQLNFNYIYSGTYFVDANAPQEEVSWLEDEE